MIPEDAARLKLKCRLVKPKHTRRCDPNASGVATSARNEIGSFRIGRRTSGAHIGLVDPIIDAIRSARMHTRDQAQLPAFLQSIALKGQLQDQVAGPVVAPWAAGTRPHAATSIVTRVQDDPEER